MKKAISALTFLGFVLANNLNIQVESRWANNLTSYVLSCGGAQGQVQYYVSGLPNGV
jgi:hypothetical protein